MDEAALRGALGPAACAALDAVAAAAGGARVALVGGAVRDLLRGEPLKDLDVVVEGDAVAVGRRLVAAAGGALRVHRAFGTATWATPGLGVVDLATARAERYPAPAALPEVRAALLEDDCFRRDFTVNAVALVWSPGLPAVLDPWGGRADLAARRLRVLHPASFVDDPTRAWRGGRFAARFGAVWAEETAAAWAAAVAVGAPAALGRERLGAEVERVFTEPGPAAAVRALDTWGVLAGFGWGGRGPDWARLLTDTEESAHHAADPVECGWLALACAWPAAEREAASRLVRAGGAALERWRTGPPRLAAAAAALDTGHWDEIGAALAGLAPAERRVLARQGWGPAFAWWRSTGAAVPGELRGADFAALGLGGRAVGQALEAARRARWAGATREAALAHGRAVAAGGVAGGGEPPAPR